MRNVSASMKIPYKHLTLFVVGILSTISIGFIVSEKYLSSAGFEYRRSVYDCLIVYLNDQDVEDDFFPTIIPEIKDDENCSVILEQFNVLEDMESNLYSSYNTTSNVCKELMVDKKMKLCSFPNDVKGSDNQSKDSDGAVKTQSSCFELSKFFTDSEISKYQTRQQLFEDTRNICKDADVCVKCIRDILTTNDDYKNTILHAKAVNLTIVDYQVWNYFLISSRVHQLVSEIHDMENNAVNGCKMKKRCADVTFQ